MAGYGCIAASVKYNKQAVASYNDYLGTESLSDQDSFYDNSVKEDNLSEIFAYAAIGIWVTDFIWTVAGSSNLNKDSKYSQMEKFSIKPKYDPRFQASTLALSFNF